MDRHRKTPVTFVDMEEPLGVPRKLYHDPGTPHLHPPNRLNSQGTQEVQ